MSPIFPQSKQTHIGIILNQLNFSIASKSRKGQTPLNKARLTFSF